jgi:hypothetical protein
MYYSREPRKHKTRGDSVDEDEETGTGIITETVGSYTDESGNKVGHIKSLSSVADPKHYEADPYSITESVGSYTDESGNKVP